MCLLVLYLKIADIFVLYLTAKKLFCITKQLKNVIYSQL
jgi:hypothetical protein